MLLLGIESTCDETAAAVVDAGRIVRSNIVASQADLHAVFRGVVPEVASRAHVEQILPVIRQALAQAGTPLEKIDAIAVAYRPGLIGSLLIGVTAAKTLAWSLGKPLIGVDHVHAHLYSVMLDSEIGAAGMPSSPSPGTPGEGRGGGRVCLGADSKTPTPPCRNYRWTRGGDEARPPQVSRIQAADPQFPAVGLVCSGGHTALYRLNTWQDVTRIGSTIDDAVGEAYDKVAAILGLPYPGGPVIDRLAATGNPKAIAFPRTLLERDSLDFSFSGLKTAVLYHVRGVPRRGQNIKSPSYPAPTGAALADIAASFQAACVDVLIEKLARAARQTSARSLILGGGVSANRGLRTALTRQQLPIYLPPLSFCTDNAAMSAGLGHLLLAAGKTADLNLDAMTSSQFVG